MTGAAKRKGDAAEREAAELIHNLLGVPVRRKLGAGRQDDEGDLDGVPDTAVQVVSRTSDVVNVCMVRKPVEADEQAARAGAAFSATFVRIRGGTWRVVMTPEMWATYWREAVAPQPQAEWACSRCQDTGVVRAVAEVDDGIVAEVGPARDCPSCQRAEP